LALPVAAFVATKPPYEWATNTFGPGIVCRKLAG
jgi:hypothetical protein